MQNQWGGREHPFVTDVVDNSGSAPLKEGIRMPSYIVMNRGEVRIPAAVQAACL
jgi:hypothetical protein